MAQRLDCVHVVMGNELAVVAEGGGEQRVAWHASHFRNTDIVLWSSNRASFVTLPTILLFSQFRSAQFEQNSRLPTSMASIPPNYMLQFAAVAAVTLVAGFYIGRSTLPDRIPETAAKSCEEDRSSSTKSPAPVTEFKVPEGEPMPFSDDEDDQGELSEFSKNLHEECKLVLVVRTDLGMTKGMYSTFCEGKFMA
jgi:hypothetical protein